MIKGYDLLVMANKEELKPKTIVRTESKYQIFNSNEIKNYDYYIYHNDKMFHRCHEDGRLGSKYQNRFLNYEVLQQDFEIHKELEENKKIEKLEIETYKENELYCKKYNIVANKINELIEELNKLKESR